MIINFPFIILDKMIKKFFVYLFGNALGKAIVFLMLPIYTNHFTVSDYGTVDTIVSVIPVIVSVGFLDVFNAILRFAYSTDKLNKKGEIVNNALVITIFSMVSYALIIFTLSLVVPYGHYGLVVIYGLSYLYLNFFQFTARSYGKSVIFTISGVLSNIVEIICNLFLVLGCGWEAKAILLAGAIGKCLGCIYLIFALKSVWIFRIKDIQKKTIITIIKFSVPLALNSVAYWGMTNINQLISYHFLGAETNGYLGIANKFSLVISVLINVYSLAWQERALDEMHSENKSKVYSTILSNFAYVLGLGTCIYAIIVKIFFPLIIGQEFWRAFLLIPFMLISNIISGMSNLLGQLFSVENITSKIIFPTICGGIINIVFLFLLLPFSEVYAIPIAMGIGFLINTIMRYRAVKKVINIKLDIKKLIAVSIIVAGSTLLINIVEGGKLLVLLTGELFLLFIPYRRETENLVGKILNIRHHR